MISFPLHSKLFGEVSYCGNGKRGERMAKLISNENPKIYAAEANTTRGWRPNKVRKVCIPSNENEFKNFIRRTSEINTFFEVN